MIASIPCRLLHDSNQYQQAVIEIRKKYSVKCFYVLFDFFLSKIIQWSVIRSTLTVLSGEKKYAVWPMGSPSIYKFCISSILENISSMCFVGLTNISYFNYADDILLISRSKLRLSHMVHKVSYSFTKICLLLKVGKCEHLSFNFLSPSKPLSSKIFPSLI